MSNKREYMTRTDFLPREGLIYVDTCALRWVRSDMDIGDRTKSLERARSFRNVFRRRGNVSSAPLVLGEIGCSRDFYKAMKKGMVDEKKAAKKDGHNTLFTLDDMHEVERFHRTYAGVYQLLESGMKKHSPMNKVSPDDVRKFVYDGNEELSGADSELVYTALVAGNGHGILSADMPLLKKYRDGAKEFHLPRAFICDAVHGVTRLARGW